MEKDKSFFLEKTGPQLLLAAAEDGDKDEVNRLIEAGVDINCVDNKGQTPLMKAVISDNMFIVDRLLKLGADPNMKDKMGKTASDYWEEGISRNGHSEDRVKAGYSLVRIGLRSGQLAHR